MKFKATRSMNLLGRIFFALSLLLTLNQNELAAQTGQLLQSARPSSKTPILGELGQDNSGEFQLDLGLRTPPTKFPIALRLHYNSESSEQALGRGWSLAMPRIVQSQSSLSFFNGVSAEPLYAEGQSGWYHTRHNERFQLQTGIGYRQVFPDGRFNSFFQRVSSTTSNEWLLTSTEDRFGLKTNLLYSSLYSGRLPYRINVDEFSGVPSSFNLDIQANAAGNLVQDIVINSSTGTALRRYHLSYTAASANQSLLQGLSEYDRANVLVSTQTLTYYTQGSFALRLKQLVTPSGGTYTVTYAMSDVRDPQYGQVGIRPRIKEVKSDNGLGQILSTSFNFSGGTAQKGKFIGFSDLSVTFPDGSSGQQLFELGLNAQLPLRGMMKQSLGKDNSGALSSQSWTHYARGGSFNELVTADRVVEASYGASGAQQLLTAQSTTFDFANFRPISIVKNGEVSSYDPVTNQVVDHIPSDNSETLITYHTIPSGISLANLPESIIERSGNGTKIGETRFNYDNAALLTSVDRWDSSQQPASYVRYSLQINAEGNVRRITSPDGVDTVATYEGFKIKTLTIDPANYNFVTTFDYDPDSQEVVKITPPSGILTEIDYDDAIRVKSIRTISGAVSQTLQDLTYSIGGISGSTSNNLVTSMSRGIESRLYFDGLGRVIQDKSFPAPDYLTNDYQYGPQGLSRFSSTYSTQLPNNTAPVMQGLQSYQFTLDQASRTNTVTPALLGNGSGIHSLSSDLAGDPHGMLSTDALSKIEYLTKSGSSTVTGKGSGAESLTLEMFGDIPTSTARIIDLAGNSFSSTFDSLGRALSLAPAVSSALQITYRPNGWLQSVSDALGGEALYHFDPLGRMTHVSATGPSRAPFFIDYYYDSPTRIGFNVPKGFASALVGPFDTIEFNYTALGEIAAIIQTVRATGEEFVTQFDYNSKGLVDDVTYPNGLIISTEYDARNLEKRVFSNQLTGLYAGGVISDILARNDIGDITNRVWGNGVQETLGYHQSSGDLHSYSANSGGQILYSSISSYDDQNLVNISEQIPGQIKSTAFGYDAMDRLKTLTIDGAPYTLSRDTLGRVVGNSQEFPGMSYQYANALSPYLASELSGASTNFPIQYNTNKEATSSFGRSFEYNALGDLVRVADNSGNSVSFERSVLGNHLRTFENSAAGTKIVTKIGAGLYELIQDPGSSSPYGRVYVIGEKSAGSVGTIAIIDFAASSPPLGIMGGEGTEVTPTPVEPHEDPICGNGVLEDGEECDDNNTHNDDGCSDECKWEPLPPGTVPPGLPKPSPTPLPPTPPTTTGTTVQSGPDGTHPTNASGGSTGSTIPDRKLQSETTDPSNHTYTSVGVTETGPCDEVRDTIVHINIETDLPTSIDDTGATYATLITGTLSSGKNVVLGYGFFHGSSERHTMVYFDGASGEIVGSTTSDGKGGELPFPDPSDLWRMPDWYMDWLSQNPSAKSHYEILEDQQHMEWLEQHPRRRYGALPLVTDQYISVPGILTLSVGLPTLAASTFAPGPEDLVIWAAARTAATGVATGTRVCEVTRTLIREWRVRRVAKTFKGEDLCLGINGEFNGAFARYAHNLKGLSRYEKEVLYPKSWMNRTHLQFRKEAFRTIEDGGLLRFNLNKMDLSFKTFRDSLTSRELRYILETPELEEKTVFYLYGKPYSCFSEAKAASTSGGFW